MGHFIFKDLLFGILINSQDFLGSTIVILQSFLMMFTEF